MKRILSYALVASLTLSSLSGCAAMFNSGRNKVQVNSNPSGADVYVDGNYRGRAPIKIKMDRKEDHMVTIKYGGKEQTYTIESSLGGGWIVLDVLGGLAPIIIDAATGSWYKLEPKIVTGNFN